MRRPEHPLVVALVESYARDIDVPPAELWAALDGEPARPELIHGLVEAFFPLVRESDFGRPLPSRAKNSTIRTMRTNIAEARQGRPLKHTSHPLIAALTERGITLTEEAAAVKRSATAVRNYLYSKGEPSARPVPRELAELWRKRYGVPLSAWSRIQD